MPRAGILDFTALTVSGCRAAISYSTVRCSCRAALLATHMALLSFASCALSAGELSFREVQFDYKVEALLRRRKRPLPSHEIARPWPWTVTFEKTRFTGATVDFSGAQFVRGYVNLSNAFAASGSMLFQRARFSEGCLAFKCSKFQEFVLDFSYATFTRNDEFSPFGPLRQRWLGLLRRSWTPKERITSHPGGSASEPRRTSAEGHRVPGTMERKIPPANGMSAELAGGEYGSPG